jgi:hypothetical protein
MAVEDHGGGAQSVRLRFWPRIGGRGVALALALAGLGALAARDGALAAAALLGASGVGLLLRSGLECMAATGAVLPAAAQAEEPTGGRQRPSDRVSGGFAQAAAR